MEDYGYSNYTVEGTEFICLKRLHPDSKGFDRFYGEDKRLMFAAECAGFAEGCPVEVDVDQDEMPYGASEPWWHFYIEDDERRQLAAALDVERAQF